MRHRKATSRVGDASRAVANKSLVVVALCKPAFESKEILLLKSQKIVILAIARVCWRQSALRDDDSDIARLNRAARGARNFFANLLFYLYFIL
jgi:hypothetical protein